MPYQWISEYCLSKKGAIEDYQPEWEAMRYMVENKMFVMQGEDNKGNPILTVKLDPEQGAAFRRDYEDIIPGYYMNKQHWNSILLYGRVPDDLIKEMIDESYFLVFSKLPKKVQQRINLST